jgi:hypothetical protein
MKTVMYIFYAWSSSGIQSSFIDNPLSLKGWRADDWKTRRYEKEDYGLAN